MRKLRLLEFVTSFEIGGTERQVANLLCALDRSRFDLHVACFQREGAFLGAVEARREPLLEFRLRSLRSVKAAREQLRLARYCDQNRIEVVHSYGFYPNVFGIAAARMARVGAVVASIRDTGDHLTPFQRRIQRWTCRMADRVLVNAQAVRERLLEEGYPDARIQVIPNGISTEQFRAAAGASRLRGQLGLPATAPLVGVFSRLTKRKGIEYFLDAAAILARSDPSVRFVVVGDSAPDAQDGPCFRAVLERRAAALGLAERVLFTGRRSDVAAILPEFTVSVLPSLSEGLSNAILESMAAGLPVVATNVGGNPELVRHGITGFLVPPRDAAALAKAMATLLADRGLAARFGEAGRSIVSERFSLEAMVRETEKVYERLLLGRRSVDAVSGSGSQARRVAG